MASIAYRSSHDRTWTMVQPQSLASDPKLAGVFFCGLSFKGLDRGALLEVPDYLSVVPTNAQMIGFASRSPSFRACLMGATLTFDGQFPYLLARWRYRGRGFDKISGSELIYDLFESAARMARPVYILGASPEVSAAARSLAMDRYGVRVEGSTERFDAFGHSERDAEILADIACLRPAYVLVALGVPKQEFWLLRNEAMLRAQGVRMALCCGGSVDIFVGKVSRAPVWVQRFCLEWLYRLIQQPSWARLSRLLDYGRMVRAYAAESWHAAGWRRDSKRAYDQSASGDRDPSAL
jgi:N-acetylglucosaminyldiphosphoundecaprenol N-acetyl-beta-D-mannosaminyltransferase